MLKNLTDWLSKNIYRKFMFWLMDTKAWVFVLQKIIPFIRMTMYYPRFNKYQYARMYKNLRPGDILLSVDYRKLTSIVIGGDWSHAAICVDKGEGKIEVVDMTHVGFHETDFFNFCKESERVCILRVNDPRWDEDYTKKFILNAWSKRYSEYNWSFRSSEKPDPRNKYGDPIHKSHYCSQLVTECDEDDILDVDWTDLAGLGVEYISPTGLHKCKNTIVVDDSGMVE